MRKYRFIPGKDFFLKGQSLQTEPGKLLPEMLITTTDLGPNSAGIALYSSEQNDTLKTALRSAMHHASALAAATNPTVSSCKSINEPCIISAPPGAPTQ